MNRSLVTLLVLTQAVASCSSEPALKRQLHKARLINSMRESLFSSVEAEKSAVLATSDEESQALAREAQGSAGKINQLRTELRSLIVDDKNPKEVEKLDAFDAAWSELEGIDRRLLGLAVANTNLKAARLSAKEGAETLDRFVDALEALQRSAPDAETVRGLSRISVASLRGQSLVLIHIPTADDAEMTRLEQQLRDLNALVESNLESLRHGDQGSSEDLAKAAQTWGEYQRIVGDVLRLSRQNTNVISFDVSIHEKRHATKQCVGALSDLLAVVEAGPMATR